MPHRDRCNRRADFAHPVLAYRAWPVVLAQRGASGAPRAKQPLREALLEQLPRQDAERHVVLQARLPAQEVTDDLAPEHLLVHRVGLDVLGEEPAARLRGTHPG